MAYVIGGAGTTRHAAMFQSRLAFYSGWAHVYKPTSSITFLSATVKPLKLHTYLR